MDGFKKKMQNHERRGGISIGVISFNQIGPKHKRVGLEYGSVQDEMWRRGTCMIT
jgi:hypothetical protein